MVSSLIEGSYKDPSGFLFKKDNEIYRQINLSYKNDYEQFMGSGLYKKLIELNYLIQHEEINIEPYDKNDFYKTIKPNLIEFISYPYEWCFSQLKDAALLTLNLLKISLEYEMILKDATAFNVQFIDGKPIFIDTLSFEKYKEGMQWQAYRQFCEHFLCPLALISLKDYRLAELSKSFIDGIPLDLTSKLLPSSSNFNQLFLHVHMHAKSINLLSNTNEKPKNNFFPKKSLLGLIDSLESTIKNLKWKYSETTWSDYYNNTNYSDNAFINKKEIVEKFLNVTHPKTLFDLGANTGDFTRLAASRGIKTISLDMDYACVERNYLTIKKNNEKNILPLIINLSNPSPALGFNNNEREAFFKRKNADVMMALALIHHLAIGNNLPLSKIVKFFSKYCKNLIIEFIPKSDSQIQRMLSFREDIFSNYNESNFRGEFEQYFKIKDVVKLNDCERSMYLMEVK